MAVRNKDTKIELPMVLDPKTGLGVVVPMPLFGQLVSLAKLGMDSATESVKESGEKAAPGRASVDDRAIWYAVPTDPAQNLFLSLDASSEADVRRVMATYRELCDRLAVDAEERADIAAYDDANERDEELFPIEVADRLIAGAHPIKVFRRYRGLTQGRLAELAGTTAGYLSQIETRRRMGSTALLRRIAAALRVTVDDLLEIDLQD